MSLNNNYLCGLGGNWLNNGDHDHDNSNENCYVDEDDDNYNDDVDEGENKKTLIMMSMMTILQHTGISCHDKILYDDQDLGDNDKDQNIEWWQWWKNIVKDDSHHEIRVYDDNDDKIII